MTPEVHLEALRKHIKIPKGITELDIKVKYMNGLFAHFDQGGLWKLNDRQLDKEIKDETIDLLIYRAEKARRKGA